MSKTRVVILGAGPAGVGAAYQLSKLKQADVVLLEQNPHVGGNTGSFDVDGVRVDYGSHRLHPACDPEVLQDIRGMIGDDLIDRGRNGRIHLKGRWIGFPLKPFDLITRLPPDFVIGVARDMAFK
jgi:protoporphyrinogen oxidase